MGVSLATFSFISTSFAQDTYYTVAPNSLPPWNSIDAARHYIAQHHEQMTGHVIVNVMPGDYYITEPITFTPSDSGKNGFYVVYKNGGEVGSARIHSGMPVTDWDKDSANWKAEIGEGQVVRSLYEDGKLAIPARSPNWIPSPRFPAAKAPYITSEAGGNASGLDWLKYKLGDCSPSGWMLTDEATVRWWGEGGAPDWRLEWARLISVNASTRTLTMGKSAKPPGINDRYYIQGIKQLLESPGEFFYNSTDGELTYRPRDSQGNPDIRVPQSRRLVQFVGGGPGDNDAKVHHIRIEGLAFSDTVSVGGGNETAWSNPSAAIFMRHSNNIIIKNCKLERLGAFGVLMVMDNHHNRVEGCLIRHCGASGIWIQNSLNRESYPNAKSHHHVVTNCKIHDYTEVTIASHGGGVCLDSVSDCTVSHCEIFNAGRYALSLRGHYSTELQAVTGTFDFKTHFSRNNRFEYIRATDTVQDGADAGIVHAAHCNGLIDGHNGNFNCWRQLLISGAYTMESTDVNKPNGMFFDHPYSAANQHLENIKVMWTEGACWRSNYNETQNTTNVSWKSGFDEAGMEYSLIGLTADFPREFDSRTTIIADDHTVDYVETGASWFLTGIPNLYNGDGRYNGSNNAAQYAEWNATLPYAGYYQVSVWKMGSNVNASGAAKYTVYHANGTAPYTVAQNDAFSSNEWKVLGTHKFAAGRTGRVRLTADGGAGKAVRADAVRFVYVAPPDDTARWAVENNGTDTAGSGGGANGLSLHGGAAYASEAAVGTAALILDGIDDYASTSDHNDLDIGTGDFAISGWFYRTPNGTENLRLLSKGAGTESDKGYAVWASNSMVTVAVGNGTKRLQASASYSGTDKWHHFAVNIDRAGNMVVYINGVPGEPRNISEFLNADLSNTTAFYLGRNNGGTQYWPGKLDHIRLYKRVLHPEEIVELAVE